VRYNFITGAVNSWIATGAFEASGTIGTGQELHHDTPGVAIIVGPLIAEDGMFTWKFHKRYFATEEPFVAASRGELHIIEGAGRFEGLKGHGQVEGTVNVVTGEIVDVFTGWVHWTGSVQAE
jgi:hypothetical protein